MEHRGLQTSVSQNSLRSVPRNVSQGNRWETFRMRFNAIATTSRLRFLPSLNEDTHCKMCGSGEDSLNHIFFALLSGAPSDSAAVFFGLGFFAAQF
eukprot:9939749-Karenia_brevis.AAC.1